MLSLSEIDINLTHACNLACSFCSYGLFSGLPDKLELPVLRRLLDEARMLGVQDVHFTGGEPTLSPHLVEAVAHAVDLGLDVRLITNGTLLDDRLLDRLWSAGLRRLMLSIDGPEYLHDLMRGERGSCELTVSALRRAARRGFSCRINAVATALNAEHLASVIDIAASNGAEVVSIFLMTPVGRARGHPTLSVDARHWRRCVTRLSEAAARLSGSVRVLIEKGYLYDDEPEIDFDRLAGRGSGCSILSARPDYAVVRADGQVCPCFFLAQPGGVSLGNVVTGSLASIIEGWVVDPILASVSEPPPGCPDCSDWSRCRGGCRGFAAVAAGRPARDSRCPGPEERSCNPPGHVPLCPLIKMDLDTSAIGGSSEDVLSQ